MIITITDYTAFRAAYMMREGVGSYRPYIEGVHIEPDGRCTGTNGHALVSSPCVEPFDGEAMTIRFYANLPKKMKRAWDAARICTTTRQLQFIDVDADVVLYAIAYTVCPGRFVDYRSLLVECAAREPAENGLEGHLLAVNPAYLECIRAAFDACIVSLVITGYMHPVLVYPDREVPDGTVCLVMPARSGLLADEVLRDMKRHFA